MKNIVIVSSFLFLGFASFALEVADPHSYLDQLNGTKSFSEAWTCPSSAYVYSGTGICAVTCTAASCMSQCHPPTTKSSMFTQSCTPDGLAIYGDQGLEFNVSAKEFEPKQNWALSFIQQSAQFFGSVPTKVTINFWMPRTVTFVHYGEMEKVFADMLVLDYEFQPGTMAYSVDLLVNPAASGLNQIMKLSAGKDVLYLRKGVFDDQNP